jgi:hypothetical protein
MSSDDRVLNLDGLGGGGDDRNYTPPFGSKEPDLMSDRETFQLLSPRSRLGESSTDDYDVADIVKQIGHLLDKHKTKIKTPWWRRGISWGLSNFILILPIFAVMFAIFVLLSKFTTKIIVIINNIISDVKTGIEEVKGKIQDAKEDIKQDMKEMKEINEKLTYRIKYTM